MSAEAAGALVWDKSGDHRYETGIDHGVLYLRDATGAYPKGVAWNGLTKVTEKTTGGEATAVYADNIKYLNIMSAEELEGTIEAYTYPDEFMKCDGQVEYAKGAVIGGQTRASFGMAYRTRIGNDVDGDNHGYKLHLIYGAVVSPTEKAYSTVNDSPEAASFSWDFKTTPEVVGDTYRPTAIIVIDSTKCDPQKLKDLEKTLFGADAVTTPTASPAVQPSLPLPAAVLTALGPVVTTP